VYHFETDTPPDHQQDRQFADFLKRSVRIRIETPNGVECAAREKQRDNRDQADHCFNCEKCGQQFDSKESTLFGHVEALDRKRFTN